MTNTRDVIIKLKKARAEKHLSYGQIIDIMERNGDSIAKSTLSNLFRKGSEDTSFNYETTIRPVAKAVLGIETIEEGDDEDVQAMKTLLRYKMQRIEELEKALEQEKINGLELLEQERKRAEKHELQLLEQLAFKDKRMDHFMQQILHKDERIDELTDHILHCERCKA